MGSRDATYKRVVLDDARTPRATRPKISFLAIYLVHDFDGDFFTFKNSLSTSGGRLLISFTNPAGKHRKTTPEKATTRKLSFAVPLRLSLSLFLLLFDVSHEAFVNPQDLPPAPRPSTYTSKTNTHAHTRLFPSPSITTASLPARQTRAYCERRRRPNSPAVE